MWVSGNPGDAFGCVFHLPRKHPQLQPGWEEGTGACLLGVVRRALDGWQFCFANGFTYPPGAEFFPSSQFKQVERRLPYHPACTCPSQQAPWPPGSTFAWSEHALTPTHFAFCCFVFFFLWAGAHPGSWAAGAHWECGFLPSFHLLMGSQAPVHTARPWDLKPFVFILMQNETSQCTGASVLMFPLTPVILGRPSVFWGCQEGLFLSFKFCSLPSGSSLISVTNLVMKTTFFWQLVLIFTTSLHELDSFQ